MEEELYGSLREQLRKAYVDMKVKSHSKKSRSPKVNVTRNSTTASEIEELGVSGGRVADSYVFADSEHVRNAEFSEGAKAYLWEMAIEEKDPVTLLGLFYLSASNFWEFEREGRTALHIAAMGIGPENRELAKVVLDQLMEVRRRTYTNVKKFSDFNVTVSDYIGAIEKESRKSALELAKVNFLVSANSKEIGEYIINTTRQDKEHSAIGWAVEIRESLHQEVIESEEDLAFVVRWLIESRDCNLLLKKFKENSPTLELWRNKYESGRTVLHVAAMQGCFSLAKKVLRLARDAGDRDYIEAVDPQSSLTALQMADDIIGNRSIAEYIKYTIKRMERKFYDGFFEAYPGTPWYNALATGNCAKLLDLIKSPHLLLETYKGLTVLHVAIICQKLDLVESVGKLFGREGMVDFEKSSHFPRRLTWRKIREKKITLNEDMLHHFVSADPDSLNKRFSSTDSTSDYPKFISAYKTLIQRKPFSGSAVELAFIVLERLHNQQVIDMITQMRQSEWIDGDDDSEEMPDSPDGAESAHTPCEYHEDFSPGKISQLIDEHWHEEWDKGYEADVDFNFEKGSRLTGLRLLYACKYPLVFRDFIRSIVVSCIEDRQVVLLPDLHDGQGRTLFHVLGSHHHEEDLVPGLHIFEEVVKDIYFDMEKLFKVVHDVKGRSMYNSCAITKNYFTHNNLLLESFEDVEIQPHFGDMILDANGYAMFFSRYLVAKVLNQTHICQHIWSDIFEKDMSKSKLKLGDIKPLGFIAASTGDQEMLNLLLEENIDLTVPDENGRTTLHHVANPNLLEFSALMECPWVGRSFSTVTNLCEFQKKWKLERKKTKMIFPKRKSKADSDVEKLVNVERMACILMLLQTGVDLSQEDNYKKVPTIGLTNDVDFQKWWYELLAKDSIDKKNNFNQAAGALSVVGTLVAATSYIGPLQPPMTYNDNGYVRFGEKLVEVFMVSNTLAFYFAMASVTVAVVPALPMRRESVLSELKRAEQTVAFSLGLLLLSILTIIISFAAASMVVIQDQHSFHGSDLLFYPSILGWIFCIIAIVGFLRRIMRLVFYNYSIIRQIYKFSLSKFCKNIRDGCYEKVCTPMKLVKDTIE